MKLEHVNLTVADLERSISFYCEVFEARVRWRGEIFNTTQMRPAAHVGSDDFFIALFEAEESAASQPVRTSYAPPGVNHFGFVVEDLDAHVRRLEALGFETRTPFVYDPGRRIYFDDPDGIEVEIVEY